MKFSKMIFGALTAAILAGCGSGGGQIGSEYLGTWQSTTNARISEVIEKNGDTFSVTLYQPAYGVEGKQRVERWTATVGKDGVMVISTAFGNATYSIDKKTGFLIGQGGELRKVK